MFMAGLRGKRAIIYNSVNFEVFDRILQRNITENGGNCAYQFINFYNSLAKHILKCRLRSYKLKYSDYVY